MPPNQSQVYMMIINILLLLWEFFSQALADGFSQESELQHVSSSLQDSSQYCVLF